MTTGAWGVQAGELLKRHTEGRGAEVHRGGRLTMPSPPDFVMGSWSGWLFGEPQDRGELSARFGLRNRGELPAAFARALATLDEEAFELLCGRFVIVALDRERERCLVARDQLGAQPLVYVRVGDGLLFAEHERELLDLLPRTPGPDRLALQQWIANGVLLHGRTLYEGVNRLRPGNRLRLSATGASVDRWWNLRYQGAEARSESLLAERLREAAFAAVGRAAAGSQRPVLKLSGGLDSACVAAGLAANGFADGRAMAIAGTFAEYPDTDESELIEATARHTHLALERIVFNSAGSMLAPALEHIARWRLPPATPNLFLWQPLMARARELGVDLMLDGEGGDELFGLAPYLIADMLRAGRPRTAWSLTARIPDLGGALSGRMRLRVLRSFGVSPLVPSVIKRYRAARRIKASWSSVVPAADALALFELQASAHERREGPLWWRFQAEAMIDDRDLLDVASHYRREAVDETVDRRHPFLYDLPLIEAALRLPPQAQFDPLRDRPLLRDGLTGLIPEAVRTRHAKSYFTPLVLAGIRIDEAGLIEPLQRSGAPVRAYVAVEALERKLGIAPDERSLLSAASLWRLGIANRWLLSQTGTSS
jgi:asparagine synthase (glutamine-hydrolysing)